MAKLAQLQEDWKRRDNEYKLQSVELDDQQALTDPSLDKTRTV